MLDDTPTVTVTYAKPAADPIRDRVGSEADGFTNPAGHGLQELGVHIEAVTQLVNDRVLARTGCRPGTAMRAGADPPLGNGGLDGAGDQRRRRDSPQPVQFADVPIGQW